MNILDRLEDLHKQATTENSHYYVAATVREAAREIMRLRGLLARITNNPHISLGDQIYEVREREGLGWDGPAVKSWGDTVKEIEGEFLQPRKVD